MAPSMSFRPRNPTLQQCPSKPVRDEEHPGVAAAGGDEGAKWVTPKVVIPLETLLLPPPPEVTRYRLSINQRALDGWVEQGSPCCAAASLAGAFNALRRVASNDPTAIQPPPVLSILRQLLEEDLRERRVVVARQLGLPDHASLSSLPLLLASVELRQERRSRPLTGRKQEACTSGLHGAQTPNACSARMQ